MPDPLDTLLVTVTSPDSNIEAEIDSGYRVTLRFRSGSLGHYDEFTLEHQLGQLSRLAWAAYQRSYLAAVEASGRTISDGDPKRRAYREALTQTEVAAASDGGHVAVTSVGLERWTCWIEPGTIARLDAGRLAAELESAVANLVTQFRHQVVLLKDEHFGFDLPPDVRAELDRGQRRAA